MMKNFTPDIVHVNWGGVWLWPFVRELRKMSVPVVVTVHDPTPHEERRPLADRLAKAWFDGWQMPRAIAAASAIHVHSKSHENTVAERFGENLRTKTYVVPHGGGAVLPHGARAKSMPPELAGTPPTTPSNIFTILFFGRIQPYKGLHVLCRAVRDMLHDTPVRLVVAGKGPIGSEWMAWLKENAILINRFIEDAGNPDHLFRVPRRRSSVHIRDAERCDPTRLPLRKTRRRHRSRGTAGSGGGWEDRVCGEARQFRIARCGDTGSDD